METNKVKNESKLLPVVRFNDTKFLVDIDHRQFREAHKQNIIVPFHSQEGHEMVKAMQGTEWRVYQIDRYLPNAEEESMVECTQCGNKMSLAKA